MQEQVECNYLTCARSLRQMACQQTCMNYPPLEFLKRGKFQVDFSEHLGLTIRACLLIASGGKWKRYLCFVSIAATQRSLDGFQLKETEPLSPPLKDEEMIKRRIAVVSRDSQIRQMGSPSGRRSQLRYCSWEDSVYHQCQVRFKVRAAGKGDTGPTYPLQAQSHGQLGTEQKGSRTFRNNLGKSLRRCEIYSSPPQNFLPVT